MKSIYLLAALAWTASAATDAAQCHNLLQQALVATNPETRKGAVDVLSLAANTDPLLERLAGMLDDKDFQVRVAVVTGLTEIKTKAATAALHTPRTTFLYALRQGLGFVPLPGFGEGVASMQALLADPNVSGRASAALLLTKDKDPATVDALKDALLDKDWHVRAAAVHSLALQNNPAHKADLEPLIQDEKEEVRLRAAAGWLRLDAIAHRPRKRAR
jgi:HEAT repeat protein